MKKIISIMLAAVALLATSCEKTSESGDSTYSLSGDKYLGTLTVLGSPQEDVAFYAEEENNGESISILMPEVSFMPSFMPNLDMALISLARISTNPTTYYAEESQMVGIYDRLPLINDIIQSITNVVVVKSGDDITITFDCGISTETMGDMTVGVTYTGTQE
ncbi:MAG: hypothetical protein R3Y26_04950 [Rikenellaceae bacterium]